MKRFMVLLLVLAVTGGTLLQAQLVRGFISGTVQDSSGARVEGVGVVVRNVATNVHQETLTNGLGVYRFVALDPGNYSIAFAKSGFQTTQVGSLVVGTAQEVVLNQILAPAPLATIIEVQGSPAGVELSKSTATLERKLEQRVVENMPLTAFTRDVNALVLLAPTVTRAPGSNLFAANGQRARNNNFLIDGVDNNDLTATVVSNRVIPEGVAEFQVQTAAYSAEFGRNSGAQVSVITRGGTNRLHGDVFDYYRANWMEPLSLLNKRQGINSTPRFLQNQFGADLGGPIVRERTFFFGLVESNRFRQAADARNATPVNIPTPDGYAALRTLPLGPDQPIDSRQEVLKALSFLPDVHADLGGLGNFQNVRNVTINGSPVQVGNVRVPLPQPSNYLYLQGRVDHSLTYKDNLSYRLQADKRRDENLLSSNTGFGSRFTADQAILGQSHALSHTRSFNARLVNEFRFGYVRRNLDFPENDPVSSTVGITGFFTIGGLNTYPQARIQNSFQWQNVTTYLAGRHSLKMGLDLRRNRLYNLSAFDSKGTWTFRNLEDFMNNRAQQLAQAVNQSSFDARQTNQFYFFQDDIKVTRNLTVNLGMRYEYSDIPFGFFGAASEQIAAVGVPLPAVADKNNWAPRIGFAYSPDSRDGFLGNLFGDGRTVFRGGYGVAYDVLFHNILVVAANNYPRVVTDVKTQPDTINLYPRLLPKQATVPPLNPLAGFVNTPTDIQNPTTHFLSFSVQRQIAANNVFELGYTASRSYHQIRQGQYNPGILTPEQAAQVRAAQNSAAIPGLQARRMNSSWGPRTLIESTALADYNALFLRFDRKFSHGLRFGANYTYSRLMSDNDESLADPSIVLSSPQLPQNFSSYRSEWSRSIFDRPHRFAINYTYEVPWFSSGPLSGAAMKHVFSGWEMNGFTEFESGQPFTIRTGVDSGGHGGGGGNPPFRPNFNPGGLVAKDPVSGDLRSFTLPVDGRGIVVTPLDRSGSPLANSMAGGGNLGRNPFRGPGFANWNFSLLKTIPVTERWRVQLRADWMNFWNHRNFGNPEARMVSPSFGVNSTDPGVRSMLVSAKIRF